MRGGDIVLNKEKNIVLSPTDFPSLNQYVGQTVNYNRWNNITWS